ncbi:MAG: UDP-N-acetylmuramoyl-L-alanyl-D-glutamate--2,6-diaminopimelate ligase [Desulfatiglandales bacterium]
MKLGQIVRGIDYQEHLGDPEVEISGVAYDSREVRPGYLFVALRGHALDGHAYLLDALERGAAALVAEDFTGYEARGAALVRVSDSRGALSKIASAFYSRPFEEMNLIGITGTNGKTTTSYLLESVFTAAGRRPGVIGTINYRICGQKSSASVTTPESLDLMRLLRRMADRGATDVIMEVSSHALDQGRTRECPFKAAVFTNITRDHLDYHKTMEAYFEAKSRLFLGLDESSTAVLNLDDPNAKKLATLTPARVLTYGLQSSCQVRAEVLSSDRNGIRARLITPAGKREIRSPLLGKVNVYNILAAATAALALDLELDSVAKGLEAVGSVPGRLEPVQNRRGLSVVVDYAHTPDALLKALETLRPLTGGRLITVFGCGGDRDRGKRIEMGLVAGQHSDLVIITSDNPRSEDPLSILTDIEKGIRKSEMRPLDASANFPVNGPGYILEVDRRKAIRQAFRMAGGEDLILIAGKGHEDYQIVGRERRSFDDRKEAALAAEVNA